MSNSKNTPFISVMVPTFNQGQYLQNTLSSVLNQTYTNIEVLVGNDHSNDSTISVVRKLLKSDTRIRLFNHEKNIGRVANYRFLLSKAQGEFAINLDGDDLFEDLNFFQDSVELIKKNKLDLVTSFHISRITKEDKSTIDIADQSFEGPEAQVVDGDDYFLTLAHGKQFSNMCTIFRREVALEMGYYREDIISTDWESHFRFIQGRKIGILNKHVGIWRKHESNTSNNLNTTEIIKNLKSIYRPYDYGVHLKRIPLKKLDRWRSKMLLKFFIKHCILKIESDDYGQILEVAKKAIPKVYLNLIVYLFMYKLIRIFPLIERFIFIYLFRQKAMYFELHN